MTEPTMNVVVSRGPRQGQVLTGRRAERYLSDPAYRAAYDGETPPQAVRRGPSLLRKATNLARDVARHVADGGRKVPLAVYEERLKTCRACEYYRENHCTHRLCGCQMASPTKLLGALWWSSKSCPADPPRWGRYTGEEGQG